MYKFYNPHPKGIITDDCVKRAVVTATGWNYMEVQRQLNNYKKVTGAKSFNSRQNPDMFVKNILNAETVTPKKKHDRQGIFQKLS